MSKNSIHSQARKNKRSSKMTFGLNTHIARSHSYRNQGSNWMWRPTREAIWIRDEHKCLYCGCHVHSIAYSEDFTGQEFVLGTLDHVVPRELGGTNKPDNLATACITCNSMKQELSLIQFARYLRNRGVNASRIRSRICQQLKKSIDRQAGTIAAATRKEIATAA